jgi:putative transposase
VARFLRGDLPDGIYHVTARGVDRSLIFHDDDDRRLFLRLLAESVDRFAWRCHAFCLMGNHYHLVVETLRAHLSRGLQRLNGLYAQQFNIRHGRTGHLFGGRFHAWLLDDEDYF